MLRIISTVITMILTKVTAVSSEAKKGGTGRTERAHSTSRVLHCQRHLPSGLCPLRFSSDLPVDEIVPVITNLSPASSGYLNLSEIRPLIRRGAPTCVPLNTD